MAIDNPCLYFENMKYILILKIYFIDDLFFKNKYIKTKKAILL